MEKDEETKSGEKKETRRKEKPNEKLNKSSDSGPRLSKVISYFVHLT